MYMISLISQIGISMIVPIILCLFVGIKINGDRSNSVIVLVFVMLGCIVAFRNAYMLLKSTYESDLKKENKELEYYKELEEIRRKNLEKNKDR